MKDAQPNAIATMPAGTVSADRKSSPFMALLFILSAMAAGLVLSPLLYLLSSALKPGALQAISVPTVVTLATRSIHPRKASSRGT